MLNSVSEAGATITAAVPVPAVRGQAASRQNACGRWPGGC